MKAQQQGESSENKKKKQKNRNKSEAGLCLSHIICQNFALCHTQNEKLMCYKTLQRKNVSF